MADILNTIDEAIARNTARFDPFGGAAWDEDRVDRVGDGMRVRGARAGIEERPDPAGVAGHLLDLADHLDRMLAEDELLLLEDITPDEPLLGYRSPEQRRVYLATQRARHVANGAPEYWLSTFDALADVAVNGDFTETSTGPTSANGNTGSAPNPSTPAPDRVADAFRSEVRRQGLAPCEIEIDGRTEWLTVDSQVEAFRQEETLWVDETHRLTAAETAPAIEAFRRWDAMRNSPRPFLMPAIDREMARLTNDVAEALDNLVNRAAPVDAALEPNPDVEHVITSAAGHYHLIGVGGGAREVPCDCPYRRESASPPGRPWWKRWLP